MSRRSSRTRKKRDFFDLTSSEEELKHYAKQRQANAANIEKYHTGVVEAKVSVSHSALRTELLSNTLADAKSMIVAEKAKQAAMIAKERAENRRLRNNVSVYKSHAKKLAAAASATSAANETPSSSQADFLKNGISNLVSAAKKKYPTSNPSKVADTIQDIVSSKDGPLGEAGHSTAIKRAKRIVRKMFCAWKLGRAIDRSTCANFKCIDAISSVEGKGRYERGVLCSGETVRARMAKLEEWAKKPR